MEVAHTQNYPLPLRNWDRFSWIRSKPERGHSFDGLPFPVSSVPMASHPKVVASPEQQRQILAYRLLAHLSFTSVLELDHINPVCQQLGQGESDVELGEQERNDAIRIYCDEGGHALFVNLLASSVVQEYQIDPAVIGQPLFSEKMRGLLSSSQFGLEEKLLRHLFVSVSETLVTRILREIPYDTTVASSVRSVIGDHAADEAYHSVYFRWYFPRLISKLGKNRRRKAGWVLPQFILAFLEPDRQLDNRILEAVGFCSADRREILGDSYQRNEVRRAIREAAVPTLSMIEESELLKDELTRSLFAKQGLIG